MDDDSWEKQINFLMGEFMDGKYKIIVNNSTSTHVHVGIKGSGFTLDQVKKLALCVILFEPAHLMNVPERLNGGHFVKSNWANNCRIGPVPWKEHQEPYTRRQAMEIILGCEQENDLVELMNPNIYGEKVEKNWAWNFRNLMSVDKAKSEGLEEGDMPIGTAEFRQAPGSKTAKMVIGWIQYATGFADTAVNLTPQQVEIVMNDPPVVGNLKGFVKMSSKFQGPNKHEPRRMDGLWYKHNNAWAAPALYAPCISDPQDLGKIVKVLEEEKERIRAQVSKGPGR